MIRDFVVFNYINFVPLVEPASLPVAVSAVFILTSSTFVCFVFLLAEINPRREQLSPGQLGFFKCWYMHLVNTTNTHWDHHNRKNRTGASVPEGVSCCMLSLLWERCCQKEATSDLSLKLSSIFLIFFYMCAIYML